MGLLMPEIMNILEYKRQYGENPSVCMIGKQDIYIDWKIFEKELILFGFEYDENKLKSMRGIYPIDAFSFFEMLGFGKVSALDYSDYEGADIVFDLNCRELPKEVKGAYDFVINGGTLEHVFDVAQALRNINELAKLDGIIYHIVPLAGWVEHGFYSFSPTFFIDYYKENECVIRQINMEYVSDSLPVLYSQDCRLFGGSSEQINEYIRESMKGGYNRIILQCIVEKTLPLKNTNPIQGFYTDLYEQFAVINPVRVAKFLQDCNASKIGICGSGHDGIRLLEELAKLEIEDRVCAFYDSNILKTGQCIAGKEIKYLSYKNVSEADILIIATGKYEKEIYARLKEVGYDEQKIIIGSVV